MSNQYYLATKGVQKSVLALLNILKKVNQIEGDKQAIFDARLASDMLPFNRQIGIVSDNLKGMVSRFAQVENPKMEDNETTLDQLIERLQKTLDFVDSIPEDKYQNASSITATLPFMPDKHLLAEDYLYQFATPNVYFHITIAYAILRNVGHTLGKSDYIGSLNIQDNA